MWWSQNNEERAWSKRQNLTFFPLKIECFNNSMQCTKSNNQYIDTYIKRIITYKDVFMNIENELIENQMLQMYFRKTVCNLSWLLQIVLKKVGVNNNEKII